MRLMHLSDLHLGKRVCEFSMLEDQRYALERLTELVQAEQVDAVLIAGDLYDKPVPPVEAVRLLDGFLTALADRGVPVLIISGNHDSADRLAFGAHLLTDRGVYLSPVFDGTIRRVTLSDAHGDVCFHLLPFLKPAHIRAIYGDDVPADYTQALAEVVRRMDVGATKRNVLLCHQFLTGAARSDSEDVSVGGLDNVDVGVFAAFDYVAAGHLHSPQTLGNARYCGALLKYSFADAPRTVTLVDLGEKGDIAVRELLLPTLRDMHTLRGSYAELTLRSRYEGTATDDYLHVVLTDEQDVPDAMGKLRIIYPHLLSLEYDNLRTRENKLLEPIDPAERQSPLAMFERFFALQHNHPMTDAQRDYARACVEAVWEDRP